MAGPVLKQPEELTAKALIDAVTKKDANAIRGLVTKYGIEKIFELYSKDRSVRDALNNAKLDITLVMNFMETLKNRSPEIRKLTEDIEVFAKIKGLMGKSEWVDNNIIKGLMENYEKVDDNKKGDEILRLLDLYGINVLDYFAGANTSFKAVWNSQKEVIKEKLKAALKPDEKKGDEWIYTKSPKRVAEIIVKEIGLDRALEFYFNDPDIKTLWNKYYNIPKRAWYSPLRWASVDTEQEDRVEELISAVKDYYKATWHPLPAGILSTSAEDARNLQMLKVYLVCGWDPERTAEFIADKVKLANVDRISKNWSKTVIQNELEGGAVYYYQKDEVFRRCWDTYFKGEGDLYEDRFDKLMSEIGEWFDYPKVIGDALLQLCNLELYPALWEHLKEWKKRGEEKEGWWEQTKRWSSKTWDVINIVIPFRSAWYALVPGTSPKSYDDAEVNPTPLNVLTAIKEDQANWIDTVATIIIVLKIAKAVAAAEKAGDAALKETLKQSVEQARKDAKDELGRTLSGDDLVRAERAVDNAAERLTRAAETGKAKPLVPRLLEKVGKEIDYAKLLRKSKGFDSLPQEVQDMLAATYRDIATQLATAKQAAKLVALRESVKRGIEQNGEKARRQLAITSKGDDLVKAEEILDDVIERLKNYADGETFSRLRKLGVLYDRFKRDFIGLKGSPTGFQKLIGRMGDDFDKLPAEVQNMLIDGYMDVERSLAKSAAMTAEEAATEAAEAAKKPRGLAKATKEFDDLSVAVAKQEQKVMELSERIKTAHSQELIAERAREAATLENMRKPLAELQAKMKSLGDFENAPGIKQLLSPFKLTRKMIDEFVELAKKAAEKAKGTTGLRAKLEAKVRRFEDMRKRIPVLQKEIDELDKLMRTKGLTKAQQGQRTAKAKELRLLREKMKEGAKEVAAIKKEIEAGFNVEIERKFLEQKLQELHALRERESRLLSDIERLGASEATLEQRAALTRRILELREKRAAGAKEIEGIRNRLQDLKVQEARLLDDAERLDASPSEATLEQRAALTRRILELREKRVAGAKEIEGIRNRLQDLRGREARLVEEADRLGSTVRLERNAKFKELLEIRAEKFKTVRELAAKIGVDLTVPIDMTVAAIYIAFPGSYELLKNFFTSHPIILEILKSMQYYEVRAAAWAVSGSVEKNVPVPQATLEERRKAVKEGQSTEGGGAGQLSPGLRTEEEKAEDKKPPQVPVPTSKLNETQEQWLQSNAWGLEELKKQIPTDKLFETVEQIMKGNTPPDLQKFFDWEQHPLLKEGDVDLIPFFVIDGYKLKPGSEMAFLNELLGNNVKSWSDFENNPSPYAAVFKKYGEKQ